MQLAEIVIPSRKKPNQDRPQEILEAALSLFLAQGYSATRLEDVASLAGVSKATIYNHFEAKGRLFLAVIEHNTQCQVDGAMVVVRDHQDSMETLIRVLLKTRWNGVLLKTTGGLLKIVTSESARFPAFSRFYLDAIIEPLEAILADILRKGVASGEFRPIDAEAVARVSLGNLLILALWSVACDDDHLAHAVEALLDVCLYGLRPMAA